MATEGFSWLAFFLDAGIPEMHAQSYAEVFEDNRIQSTMMEELNKDVLQELGVAVMGDVIAIQRASRQHLESLQPVDTVKERKWEVEKSKLRRQITTLEQQKIAAQATHKGQIAEMQEKIQSLVKENKLLKAKLHSKTGVSAPSSTVPTVSVSVANLDPKAARAQRFKTGENDPKRPKEVISAPATAPATPAAATTAKPSILSRLSQASKPKKIKGRGSFKATQVAATIEKEQAARKNMSRSVTDRLSGKRDNISRS